MAKIVTLRVQMICMKCERPVPHVTSPLWGDIFLCDACLRRQRRIVRALLFGHLVVLLLWLFWERLWTP